MPLAEKGAAALVPASAHRNPERDKRSVGSKEICLQVYESGWSEPVGRGVSAQREMILPQKIILAGRASRAAV